MAVARSFSDDSAIRYVLPVLWITSCLLVIGQAIGRMFKVTLMGSTGAKSDVYDCLVPYVTANYDHNFRT